MVPHAYHPGLLGTNGFSKNMRQNLSEPSVKMNKLRSVHAGIRAQDPEPGSSRFWSQEPVLGILEVELRLLWRNRFVRTKR
jgi:hypothetical protein